MDFDAIVEEYRVRKNAMGNLFNYMKEARDHFNGDIVIPLPEMTRDEKPAVANLMAQGLDQTAMRIASVLPNVHYPALIPGKDKGTGSEEWANKRKMANLGWWQESKLNLKMRRMARWLVGYATAPMMVRPNFNTGVPEYVLRDPLSTYPSLNVEYDDAQPTDFIYAYKRTFRWLEQNHPDAALSLARRYKHTPQPSTQVELLEYIDGEERVLGVQAIRPADTHGRLWWPGAGEEGGGQEISRAPNRAGVCWGVTSNRITVDRLMGQFSQTFGIYQNQARLMALETIAVEKAIFPDIVIQGNTPGRVPVLVNGEWADGRDGDINVVRDGNVDVVQLNPGFMTEPLIDRHERSIRQAGVPAQFSGETPSNIATGRLGDQILSATVDFPIQEYQELLGYTLWEANKRAVAIVKSYFGETKKSFHVGFNGTSGQADYTPNTHFETDAHHVRYSAPGADVNSLIIGIGQRLGLETMSKWTAMQQDPLVPDADFEYRKVASERIQSALLDFVAQAVQGGMLDPQDVVILWEEVERGSNIADAWKKAQEAAQKRQAEAQQAAAEAQAGPTGAPGPEAQPGLSPTNPEEAGLAVQGPSPNMQNLSMMLGSLRQPKPTTAALGQPQVPVTPIG